MNFYTFKRESMNETASSKNEYTYACPEDATWNEVLLHFAMFLDTSGYVGVYENVMMMLDEE